MSYAIHHLIASMAQYGIVTNQVSMIAHVTPMRKNRIIWFTLAGMLVGYLLFHPFAMLANTLGPRPPHFPMEFSFWRHPLGVSFDPEMLAMGEAFAFMGGLAGFFFGIWDYQKEKLIARRLHSRVRRRPSNAGQRSPRVNEFCLNICTQT